MKELKNDKSLNAQYRNALIRQEEIALQMDALLSTKKIQEVREAVNIFLTEVMSLDPKDRTQNLRRILKDLTVHGKESEFFLEIIEIMEDLNVLYVPRT